MSEIPENKSNKPSEPTSLGHLPEDVATDIVSRLTPKEVCYFKTLSKQWNEKLSNPSFNDVYHERSSKSMKLLTIDIRSVEGWFNEYFFVKISSLDLDEERTIHFKTIGPTIAPTPTMLYAASGAGLTCFASTKDFFIFNPTSKRRASLPKMSSSSGDYFSKAGFGYDPSSKEYIFMHTFDEALEDDIELDLYVTRCEWLTLSEADQRQGISTSLSWKVLETPCPLPIRNNGVLVDGLFYFCVSDDCIPSAQEVMISIDLKSESFKPIGHPDETVHNVNNRRFVVELNGKLCFGDIFEGTAEMDLWILTDAEKKGWTKFCRVDLKKLDSLDINFLGELTVLGLRNGELIIHLICNDRLDFYNIEENTARQGSVTIPRWSPCCLYYDTLSMLNLRNRNN